MAHLQGQERAQYVQSMFARIAGRYDLMNRLMTGGQDIKWRRYVIRQANLPRNGRLLDIATGTAYAAPTFQTGDERYAWLNNLVAVGKGKTDQKSLTYELHELR